MALWIVMAVLAAAAALPVLVPLFRADRMQPMANAAQSIYRDQLDEVERDRGRGLIAEQEAEAARTEIARRLLKTSEAAGATVHRTTPVQQRLAAAVVIALPMLALALYVVLGSPGLPDQPLAARLSAPIEKQDPAIIVAKLESHMASNPDDATGWEFLATIYARLERFEDEARAIGNLIRIRGVSADLETAYGHALTRANDGVVTKEARAAFEQGNKLDPKAVGPRFFLALALTQEGKKDEAITAWHQLLQGAPEDAGWVQMGRRALASLEEAPATARARSERRRCPGGAEPHPRAAARHDHRHGRPACRPPGERTGRCRRLGASDPVLHGARPERRCQGGTRQGANGAGRQGRPARTRRERGEIGRRPAMRKTPE